MLYNQRPRKMERGDKEDRTTPFGGDRLACRSSLFVAAHPRIETSAGSTADIRLKSRSNINHTDSHSRVLHQS